MAGIVVRDPFDLDLDESFTNLREAVEGRLRERARTWPPRRSLDRPIPIDISEQDGTLTIEASLPGFDRSEVEVDFVGGAFTIRARHQEEEKVRDAHYYRRERRRGVVSRRIELPGMSDEEVEPEAILKNGVLTIKVPMPKTAQAKHVEVKAS
jgi:HSP20 family protein